MLIDDLIQTRKDQNMTQTDLAAAAGMSQSVIARIEAKKGNPSLKTIERLVAALNAEVRITRSRDKSSSL